MNDFEKKVLDTLETRGLASADSPLLLMVSGGSDSVACARCFCTLYKENAVGPVAILHVNHQLRGEESDADAAFVRALASSLGLPFFERSVDVAARVSGGENLEAAAREARYEAAEETLAQMCASLGVPYEAGRLVVAHTLSDRVETFYMRSIVGTGPGGFRAMRYASKTPYGMVIRPLLDVTRDEARAYLCSCATADAASNEVAAAEPSPLWREDATNADTDYFRAYVRAHVVPAAKERNPQLEETLRRTMNLIAEEDDMLESLADSLALTHVACYIDSLEEDECDEYSTPGQLAPFCIIDPALADNPLPLMRRVIFNALSFLLEESECPERRVEEASVNAVLRAWSNPGTAQQAICSGYVNNIQGNLAVSANKQGVRIETMAAFRARRKKH